MKLAPLATLALAGTAHAGATFEINGGVAVAHTRPESGDSDTEVGGAWPGLAVGARFGDFAITGRVALILFGEGVQLFLGPSVQWWASQRVFVGGGLGLARIGLGEDEQLPDGTIGYATLGASFRVGFNLRPERRHRFTISLEVTPAVYKDFVNTGIAIVGGYQYW